jgi:DNA-binding MarR family transcriptional regulator
MKSAARSPARSGTSTAAARRGQHGDPTDTAASIGVGLWRRLLESHALLLAEVRKRLADECTMARFDLLSNLERQEGQTLATLSRRMLVTAGNLTGLVDRAERDGVVERRRDASDRRLSRVYLTAKGRGLLEVLMPAHAHQVSELLSSLDAAERRELRRLLGKLRESLLVRTGRPTPRRRAADAVRWSYG